MACNEDDVSQSDEEEDFTELPPTWPEDDVLNSDYVPYIQEHNKKSIRLYKKYLSNKSVVYPMKHFPRGNLLLINNERFSQLPHRTGTEMDSQKITAIFSQLAFNIIVYNDLTNSEMKETLLRASKLDYSNHDCFILFILSHGDKGVVFGTDGNSKDGSNCLAITYVTKLFSDSVSLLGKPKLFFIQACQGVLKDTGKTINEESTPVSHSKVDTSSNQFEQNDSSHSDPRMSCDEMSDDEESTDGTKIPSEADIFLSTATVEGYVAWRSKKYGTLYVQAIGYIFRMYAHKHELNHLMTKVNNLVTKREISTKYKQVAAKYDTLTKTFHFSPFLHEQYVEMIDKYQEERLERERMKEQFDKVSTELISQRQQCEIEKKKLKDAEEELQKKTDALAILTEQLDQEKSLRLSLEIELSRLRQLKNEENLQQDLVNDLNNQAYAIDH